MTIYSLFKRIFYSLWYNKPDTISPSLETYIHEYSPMTLRVGDVVSTLPNIGPYRCLEEIEEIGLMRIDGHVHMACRVKGLPYYEKELRLEITMEENLARKVLLS